MTGWKRWMLGLAVTGLLLSCGGPEPANNISDNTTAVGNGLPPEDASPEPMTISEAIGAGAVNVSASGIDLQNVRFTVTAMQAVQLTIPAGCMLASADAGTQNMMTAREVTMNLQGTPEAPDTQSVEVPAYCINRYRETPSTSSSFSVETVGEDLQPLQNLARCLAREGAEHGASQFAIWAISDRFAHMTAEQFVAEGLAQKRAEMLRLGPEGLAEQVRRRNPSVDPEQLELLRATPADRFQVIVDRAIAAQEPAKRREFELMRDAARPLLEQCGYDLSTLAMYSEA